MSSTKEIVTLQFGHYSNFVGTNWWNLQESSFVYDPQVVKEFPKEVNHDVLFREGKTISGHTTFTPRLVLVDLHGSLGTLRREGNLYHQDINEENIQWVGDVTLHESEAVKKNKFLKDLEDNQATNDSGDDDEVSSLKKVTEANDPDDQDNLKPENEPIKSEVCEASNQSYHLDSDVKVWSDILRTGLHPRSVHSINEYQHNDAQDTFNIFGQGQQIAKLHREWDDLENRIRYFTEECDHLQGFQIIFDNNGGFGGLTASTLAYLSDEFSSKSRFSIAVTPATPPDQTALERATRIINSALSLHHCTDQSSLYLPISLANSLWKKVGAPVNLDHLEYKAELDYHTSAILATALDTASLPYRKEHNPATITDITGSFSAYGRKVSALNLSLPFPLHLGTSVADTLMNLGERDPWQSITPGVSCTSSPYFQSCVLRGVPQATKFVSSKTPSSQLLSSCSSVDDVLKLYLCETYPNTFNSGCYMRDGAVTSAPFPHIFTPNVNWQGYLSSSQRPAHLGVERVPTMTSLQSSSDIFPHINTLVESAAKFNLSKHQHFIEAGLEQDDWLETIQELESLANCYTPD